MEIRYTDKVRMDLRMLDIAVVIFSIIMCLWRTATYFTCYDPTTGLFERSLVHFTLPNAITAVVSVAAIVAILRMAQRPTRGWTPKQDEAGGFSLFLACACLMLAALGRLMMMVNGQMTFDLSNLLLCVSLFIMGAFSMQASGYSRGKADAKGMGTLSLASVVCVLVCLLSSFISSTEMAVVENYMYHLLVLCVAALYFLAISRSLMIQAHMGIALWYGRLLLYFALMEYVPRGLYALLHGSVLSGGVDVVIAAGLLLMLFGVTRCTAIEYLSDEELEAEEAAGEAQENEEE